MFIPEFILGMVAGATGLLAVLTVWGVRLQKKNKRKWRQIHEGND